MKKYQIIYADPPWDYQDKRNKPTKNNPHGAGGASKHYTTMPLEDMKWLPIPSFTDKNCMCLMWATGPFMKEAIELMEFWGFKFRTIPFVWIKTTKDGREPRGDGIGSYTPNNAEYILLGRKGNYWRNSTKVKQVILSPKTEHSKKPEEARKRIEELFGNVSRIELFARQKTEGWDVWGNEVESDIKL